jgi:hypothetical protein
MQLHRKIATAFAALAMAFTTLSASTGSASAAEIPGGWSEIQRIVLNAESPALCLDVAGGSTANGTRVIQWPCSSHRAGADNQLWAPEDNGNGWFRIRSYLGNKNKCLDVPAGNQANGVRLILWDCAWGPNQLFHISDDRFGWVFRIQSSPFHGSVLDMPGDTVEWGTQVMQWPYNGGSNQQWVMARRR